MDLYIKSLIDVYIEQCKYRVSNKIQVSIGIEQNLVSNQH